jgi:hypothetical protein
MHRNVLIIMALFFLGCSDNYRLTENDLRWNPYRGGEVLVFHSNNGDTDTINVQTIETAYVDSDPLDAFPNHQEILDVIVKHSTPFESEQKMEESFLLLEAGDKNTLIDFNLMAKNSWFYGESYYIDDLNKLAETELVTKKYIYKDVVIIEPQEDIKKEYLEERDEFITKIYWSKSKGYIRYDLKNGVYWELQ